MRSSLTGPRRPHPNAKFYATSKSGQPHRNLYLKATGALEEAFGDCGGEPIDDGSQQRNDRQALGCWGCD
jgi:hypothetical protein